MNLKHLFQAVRSNPATTLLVAVFAALTTWTFWPALGEMADKWVDDPQYSHGYLVPLFALVLLYLRRSHLAAARLQCNPWGVALIAVGAAGYVAGAYLHFDFLTAGSLLPVLAGLSVLFGGGKALRWAWPAVAFLAFMIPLPHRVETGLGEPLQRAATLGSTWLLQTFGFNAVSEGNIISLDRGQISVVEACSGLSMLMIFFALSTGMAMVVRRPVLDKVVILLSAAPIAVFVNMLRITSNGVAMEWWGPETAHDLFHDQAGWVMMPVALILLWFELWILSRLLVAVPEGPGAPLPVFVGATAGGKPGAAPPRQPRPQIIKNGPKRTASKTATS